jgi:hypothetical protein
MEILILWVNIDIFSALEHFYLVATHGYLASLLKSSSGLRNLYLRGIFINCTLELKHEKIYLMKSK